MSFITGHLLYDLFLIVAAFFTYSYLKFKFHSKYIWQRLNIPYIEPSFLFGNALTANVFEPTWEIVKRHYMENKEKPLLGIWLYTRPVLLVQDVDLVKNMLVKDFQHFHDRGLKVNEKEDPLEGHLFNLTGTKWRNLRVKLTPTFTSGKMKMMFPTMVECGEELREFLKEPARNGETIEVKEILARFTTDIISSCAFGIQTNSLKNPDGEFRKYGRKIFAPGIPFIIYRTIMFNFKFLQKIFPLRRRPKEVSEFFRNAVKETIEHREKNNIKRNDFMDLIIQLKNQGKVEGADNDISGDVSATEFTFDTAAAQAFVFFAAGFETSSTTMQFALYELARNPDMQKKLQNEIDVVLKKYNNIVTYEAVLEMEYLDCVVNESLRKYPPVPLLPRECTKDYTFPGTNVTIKKGTFIFIPIIAIQNDPRYFPNPDKFDPDRFTAEEKSKRDKFLHIPFGEGPRICIGNRFGLMQSKTGLIYILSRYNVEIAETTSVPVKMDPTSFIPSPLRGMNLKITSRGN